MPAPALPPVLASCKPAVPKAAPPRFDQVGTIALRDAVSGIAWSPDGDSIATSQDWGRSIDIWSFPQLHLLRHIAVSGGSFDLAFTKDSKYLVTAPRPQASPIDQTAFSVFDAAKGTLVKDVPGPFPPASPPLADQPAQLALGDEGRVLYVSYVAHGGSIYVYSTANWAMISKIDADALSFIPVPNSDDILVKRMTSPAGPPTWSVWDAGSGRRLVTLDFVRNPDIGTNMLIPNPVSCLWGMAGSPNQFFPTSPPGSQPQIYVHDKWAFTIFDIRTLKTVDTYAQGVFQGMTGSNRASAGPDGGYFVSPANDENAADYYVIGDPTAHVLHRFSQQVWDTKFSANGKFLAVAGDSEVLIYKVGGG